MPLDCSALDQLSCVTPSPNPDVAYLRQHVTRFIAAVDQQEQLHTQVVTPLPLGTWNVAVLLHPGQIVLKLSPWSTQFEADFLRLAGTTPARVPRLLNSGSLPDSRLPQASYLLMDYIAQSCPAGPLLEQGHLAGANLLALGRALGTTLAQLHQVVCPTLRHFEETPSDWGTSLGLWQLDANAQFDDDLLRVLGFLLERTAYRTVSSGTLIHSDANLHNVLVDPQDGTFRALIDPGPLIVGLPMYDLAVATQPWVYGIPYLESVIQGYQQAGGTYDPHPFVTSLLVVAYQHARDYQRDLRQARQLFTEYLLPRIAGITMADVG